MRAFVFFFLFCGLLPGNAFSQVLEEAIATYEQEIADAKRPVEVKWQQLHAEALSKNDQALAGQYLDWSNSFRNEGGMFMPVKDPEMTIVFRTYGGELKKAGDKLRKVYLAEIERLNQAGETDEAAIRLNELTEFRLPGNLLSIQPARKTFYVNHYGWVCRVGPVKLAGEKMNATFEETSGLSAPGLLSLRPINFPRMFVAHHGFRVNLQAYAEDPTWKLHATWEKLPGLSDSQKGCSYRSVSHPDRYIRVRANGEVWLDKLEQNEQFRVDATFYEKQPLYPLWQNN